MSQGCTSLCGEFFFRKFVIRIRSIFQCPTCQHSDERVRKTAARTEFDVILGANELFYRLITRAGNLRKCPGPERNN